MKRISGPFGTLLADPPWQFQDNLPGRGRGASKHYHVLSVADIARFPLPALKDDAWLFLWRVHTHQDEAMFVMRAWGFDYCSELVWEKLTKDLSRPKMGMGRTLRMQHEVCLIGRRGRPERLSKAVGSIMRAPLRNDLPKEDRHSSKPLEQYEVIQRLADGPFCELFARREQPGWTAYGNALVRPHPGFAGEAAP